MTRYGPRIDFHHPRFPIWQCRPLLEKATTVDELLYVSNDAIRPTDGDPVEAYSQSNRHTLYLGPQRLIHEQAKEIVCQIQGQFDFYKDSPWFAHSGMIAGLIRIYFPEGSHELGGLSIMPMRRPALFRSQEEQHIEVTSAHSPRSRFLRRKVERGWKPKIRLGGWTRRFDLPLAGLPFACSANSSALDNRWAKLFVRRHVRSKFFLLPPGHDHYDETWLCLACPGRDEARLSKGHIPAIDPSRYLGNALRLRATPILNLMKIGVADLHYQLLAIKIDAWEGGLFLSIRHSSMPWLVGLLNAAPVEHIGVCQIVRRFLL